MPKEALKSEQIEMGSQILPQVQLLSAILFEAFLYFSVFCFYNLIDFEFNEIDAVNIFIKFRIIQWKTKMYLVENLAERYTCV